MSEWEPNKQLSPEEEPLYIKDLCETLRNQQTLSEPTRENPDGHFVCDIIPDPLAAHAADVIEELWERLSKYEPR